MWLRSAFFRWLFPAALVLPLWLLIGWGVFQAGGWAFLWVILIAVPSVLIGELVLTLLTRARPSVRAERAVSWWDVLGFGIWHALTIAVGFFPEGGFPWLLTGAIVAWLALFWLQLWQLWSEARGSGFSIRETATWSTVTPGASNASERDVIIVQENDRRD
ncbi:MULTISPECIES: MFS transporter permease [unclassified Microbacterium]|uniref:MFS transporter permease n=1 Tax=unclassified Microbacterium TaxID=2609290 RepID=UPI0012F93713|nr:MFS transporter permease [Microbacterium sp. MAH-37]MVQ42349.1 MFS transporter permease [Microbacterium sp. MAH-37]